MQFQDIDLNTRFTRGDGLPVHALPNTPGIYAQVYWPARGLRIGETGRSIRAKIRHDIGWFRSMHLGTAPEAQLRRTLPIAMAAKATGEIGFEFFVVSTDPRLIDKGLRQEAERRMFEWAESSPDFEN